MSIESEIKSQYEEIFRPDDWSTFKVASDYYLENASKLLKKDIKNTDENFKLLFRNIQKRLFIGIAFEFLLKSIFLKYGFMINKRKVNNIPPGRFPFVSVDVDENDFSKSRTLTFNDLSQKLPKVINLDKNKQSIVNKGVKIAKVFRNKEGHIISVSHEYISQNYRDIEECLKLLYSEVFDQKLEIHIAFSKNELGVFNINK